MLEELNEKIYQESEDRNVYIPEVTRKSFHRKIESFVTNEKNNVGKHTSSNKHGSILYNKSMNYLDVIQSMALNLFDKNNNDDEEYKDFAQNRTGLPANTLMHSLI